MAKLDVQKARDLLQAFDFGKLFVEELGWSQPTSRQLKLLDGTTSQQPRQGLSGTYLDYISRTGRQRRLQSRSEEITQTPLRQRRQRRASLHPRRQLDAPAYDQRSYRLLQNALADINTEVRIKPLSTERQVF